MTNTFAPLQRLESIDSYRQLFADTEFWSPFVAKVCHQQQLSPSYPVRVGLPGTFPTFIVADRWVVKFFGRLFGGGESFAIEREAARMLANDLIIPTARLLAEGELTPGYDWCWPYLVFEYVAGTNLGEVWDQVCEADRLRIASDLGKIVRRLYALPLVGSTVFPADQSSYLSLLQKQRSICVQNHREWGSLPACLVNQIDDFIPPLDDLIHPAQPAHLIHADLNADHLLGRLNDGRWQTLAVIDFGDAMTGDLFYELAALHLGLFRGERSWLAAFLDSYGLPREERRRLPRRAMATALLHQFNVFTCLTPDQKRSTNLEEFTLSLWDVTGL
jgi:hygromycin-B 7''-O-kinase